MFVLLISHCLFHIGGLYIPTHCQVAVPPPVGGVYFDSALCLALGNGM